jgi:hypothetical protein
MSNTGPEDDQNALREKVRAALAAGLLPLGRLAAVVRRGTGRRCFICGRPIVRSELEHEVQTDDRGGGAAIVHEPCHRLWRVETAARIGKVSPEKPGLK